MWFVLLAAFTTLALVGAVVGTYTGWAPHDPTWTALLEYPNRLAGAHTDPAAFSSAAMCGECHRQHYDEWRASAMGRSAELARFLVDLYEIGLDFRGAPRENVAYCLHCHAPLAVMGKTPDLELRRPLSYEGVTCDVCHTAVVAHTNDAPGMIEWDPAGPKRGPLPGPLDALVAGVAPAVSSRHGTRRAELIESSDLCGTCHMSLWPTSALPIDWTYPEWKRSAYAERGVTCQSCHMPTYRGVAAPGAPERDNLHRHNFPGGGDDALLRRTARIEVAAASHFAGYEVVVRVENTGAGHAFPTGNANFPVVELRLRAFDDDAREVFTDAREYRLTYVDAAGTVATDPSSAVSLRSDTTLQPLEPRFERFYVPRRLAAVRVEAELVYHRWSREVRENYARLASEVLGRYAREGLRVHRLLARVLDTRGKLDRVRALTPVVVARDGATLPPLPRRPPYVP